MATANTQDLTDATFEAEVLKSAIPVLVDFWAEWCGPCRQLSPIVEEIAEELSGRLKVCSMDVQEHTQVATQFQITGIPALLLFREGELVEKLVGLQPKRKLLEAIEPHL